ncbi:MAG: Sec-independent protein translocase subunit TatA/TatB [Flavobacterium sp.]
MFGIGGGELLFVMLVILMLFGSDKIPEFARAFAKGMAQLKNATNEIKDNIQGSGLNMDELTGGISTEINKAKEGFTKMIQETAIEEKVTSEIDQLRNAFQKESTDLNEAIAESKVNDEIIEEVDPQGPIKRNS